MGTKTQKLSNVVDQIVEWQSVFTGDGSTGLTAVAGRGYFINTTSGTVTVTLPASPKAGDIVQLKDYARTWGTNAVSTSSALFDGDTLSQSFSTNGQTVTLIYMDGTKGWSLINEDTTSSLGAAFIAATGGTITTSGDYKIHSFTGDGCFVVSCGGNSGGSNTVDYLVIAGGASGGTRGGGGGAGGYRESSGAASGCYTVSPLGACVSALPVSATTYPITVGAGGAPNPGPDPITFSNGKGNPGSNSVFSTITSAGGGGGGAGHPNPAPNCEPHEGLAGGSGGGGVGHPTNLPLSFAGAGNTPPVSPPQGNPGGKGTDAIITFHGSGGGGGAGASGSDASPLLVSPTPGSAPENLPYFPGCGPGSSGPGGNGATSSITGSPVTRAGGGGGGMNASFGQTTGGSGGGGAGGYPACQPGVAGTANTGSGGGGSQSGTHSTGAGGKGIVIIRYKFQN